MSRYDLEWDARTLGEPVSLVILVAAVLLSGALLITRAVMSRRITKRSGVVPLAFRRSTLAVCVVLPAAALAYGLWEDQTSDYRERQQADFIHRELGVRVKDPSKLTGFHAGSKTFDIDEPEVIRGCILDTYFIDKQGHLTSEKPRRGQGNGRLAMFIECPEPIPSRAARDRAS